MNDQAEALRKKMGIYDNTKEADSRDMNIITVASGKGGVGKSNFSVNLGLAIKDLGHKVMILDADFGLANVEIILGERPKFNLSHLINESCEIEDVVSNSKYGIDFISGGSGIREMNFLPPDKLEKISLQLGKLNQYTDNLIIDTGAGINDIVVKFCKLATSIYIVVTPEPTSVTDSYALIKTLISQFGVDIPMKLVINKVINQKEAHEVFNKLSHVTDKFLGAQLQYGGFIPYDEQLFMAAREQVPITKYNQRAKSSMAYNEIAKEMMGLKTYVNNDENGWINRFKKIFSK